MKNLIVRFAVATLCLTSVRGTAKAQSQIPVSGKEAAGIFGALIGVGVGVGVGIYFLVRAPHNITGCVSDADGRLQLIDENGTNHYWLDGETTAIKSSERLRLSGKPGKRADKQKTFMVKKIAKDYGPCSAGSAAR